MYLSILVFYFKSKGKLKKMRRKTKKERKKNQRKK